MNLFTAAVYSNNYMPGQSRYEKLNQAERDIVVKLPNILESYHYVDTQKAVDQMRNNGARVFLDSGAFSAHTLGVEINIEDYCNYIIANKDILRVDDGDVMASVLDGIGDPKRTWENQIRMEQLGAKPLPCFHYGEDPAYLEWYVERYKYITIGGMVGRTQQQLVSWLDTIWERYLIDRTGSARLKVHAFGITAFGIMERYPWHSVDSSSWIQSAAFGSIVTPQWGAISISDKSPGRKQEGRHLTNFSHLEQAAIATALQQAGFGHERLSTIYESRAAYNLWAYGVINDKINANKRHQFINEQQGFF